MWELSTGKLVLWLSIGILVMICFLFERDWHLWRLIRVFDPHVKFKEIRRIRRTYPEHKKILDTYCKFLKLELNVRLSEVEALYNENTSGFDVVVKDEIQTVFMNGGVGKRWTSKDADPR